MATRPSDARPVTGRVDPLGRLVAADRELELLQVQAGSTIGAAVAIPQLAAIVRTARQLRIPVARRALAAGPSQDIDMWVRAVPDGDFVALTIERWDVRPAAGPRLAAFAGDEADALSRAGHWSVDEHLRILSLSDAAAELIGVSSDEAAGQLITRLVKLEEGEAGEMPMLEALTSRTSFEGQRVRRRSDGAALILGAEAVLGKGGAFAGFEGSVSPVDTGDSAPQPAPPAAVPFDELLGTPIRRIIASAEEIAGRPDGPLRDEYAAYAGDISAAARHLLSVMEAMAQDGDAGRSTIDLVELVYEAVGMVDTAASERGIVVAVEPLRSFTAHGDPRGVMQILVNLIGNAVRHSPERATVTISFERSNGHAIVHVADDGPGIEEADQQRIFERFERGRGTSPGSGLGLAIARRLAQSMDGDIRLASTPGKGSRFSLSLPAA